MSVPMMDMDHHEWTCKIIISGSMIMTGRRLGAGRVCPFRCLQSNKWEGASHWMDGIGGARGCTLNEVMKLSHDDEGIPRYIRVKKEGMGKKLGSYRF